MVAAWLRWSGGLGNRWKDVFMRYSMAIVGLLFVLIFFAQMEFSGVGWRSSILTARKVTGMLLGIEEWTYVYHRNVSVDHAKIIINDTFSVPEECNYSFRLLFPRLPNRPKNDEEWLEENKDKVWPKTFRVSAKLNVVINNKKERLVTYVLNKGSNTSSHPFSTRYSVGRVTLLPGKYSIQVELLESILRPVEGDISFVVLQKPCSTQKIRDNLPKKTINQQEYLRRKIAEMAFRAVPQKASNIYKNNIREGKMVNGMTPFEAYLAGGEFDYSVTPDPDNWNADADLEDVIWAQANQPDNSEIKMTFSNETQFPESDQQKFDVIFRNGRVGRIVRGE